MANKKDAAGPVVRIRAYQTSPTGWMDVRWIVVVATKQFAERLRRLVELGKANDLTESRISLSPEAWGPQEVERDGGINNPELVVSGEEFWFRADPDDDTGHFESEGLRVEAFLGAVATGKTSFGTIEENDVEEEESGEGNDDGETEAAAINEAEAAAAEGAEAEAESRIGAAEQSPDYCCCTSCVWEGVVGDLAILEDVHERVLAGEFMAAGGCPLCGALIEVADVDIPQYTLDHADRVLAQRGIGHAAALADALDALLKASSNDDAGGVTIKPDPEVVRQAVLAVMNYRELAKRPAQ